MRDIIPVVSHSPGGVAQLVGHISTMTKSKHLILLVTNIVMLVAGLVGSFVFLVLTDQYSTYGNRGYASSDVIYSMTNTLHIQVMAEKSASEWRRFSHLIDSARWFFLGLGLVLVVGSVIHFCLMMPSKPKD